MSNTNNETDIQQRAKALLEKIGALRSQIHEQIIGQDQLVEDLLVALLAGGHVLLEGLPGLGKTMLVKALASGLGLDYSRVQFTPDLMPSDVTVEPAREQSAPYGQRSHLFRYAYWEAGQTTCTRLAATALSPPRSIERSYSPGCTKACTATYNPSPR